MEPFLWNQKDEKEQEAAESTVNKSKFVLPVLAVLEGQGKAPGLAISRILDEVAVLQLTVVNHTKENLKFSQMVTASGGKNIYSPISMAPDG